MSIEPNRDDDDGTPAMPGPDDYVVFEVDGFAQLTPEQKTWPVVSLRPRQAPPPPTAPGTSPSPPG
jgi:hypothetical protein